MPGRDEKALLLSESVVYTIIPKTGWALVTLGDLRLCGHSSGHREVSRSVESSHLTVFTLDRTPYSSLRRASFGCCVASVVATVRLKPISTRSPPLALFLQRKPREPEPCLHLSPHPPQHLPTPDMATIPRWLRA